MPVASTLADAIPMFSFGQCRNSVKVPGLRGGLGHEEPDLLPPACNLSLLYQGSAPPGQGVSVYCTSPAAFNSHMPQGRLAEQVQGEVHELLQEALGVARLVLQRNRQLLEDLGNQLQGTGLCFGLCLACT